MVSPRERVVLTFKLNSLAMILLEVHDGLLDDGHFSVTRLTPPGGWRLLTPCDQDVSPALDESGQPQLLTRGQVFRACPLLREGFSPQGSGNATVFGLLLDLILTRLQDGGAIRELFDKKQLHEVGTATIVANGKAEHAKILQFEKKRSVVRILWLFGRPAKTLLITHTFIKPGGKVQTTPRAETERAERIFQEYALAHDARVAQLITAQGGRNAYESL